MGNQNSGGSGSFGSGWIIALAGAAGIALLTGGTSRFLPRLLKLIGFGAAGLLLLLAAVLVIALIISRKDSESGEGKLASSNREVLGGAHKDMTALRLLGAKIGDTGVRAKNTELCAKTERLLAALKEKPEHILESQAFFGYYLDAQKKLLNSFAEAEKEGRGEDVKEKILAHMETVEAALEEQQAGLADDVLLDLSAEMEVLTRALQRDGLN